MSNNIVLPGPKTIPLEDVLIKDGGGIIVDIDDNPVKASSAGDSDTLEGNTLAEVRADIDATTLDGEEPSFYTPDVYKRIKLIDARPIHGGERVVIVTELDEILYRGVSNNFSNAQESANTFEQFINISMPQDVAGKVVKDIQSGVYNTFVLYTDGTLYSWGTNGRGELGIGNFSNTSKPTKIAISNVDKIVVPSSARQITAAAIFAITTTNQLFAWGDNSSGALGIGNTTNQNAPILVSVDGGKAVKDVYSAGGDGGWAHVVTTDETLYASGNNAAGQLGLSDTSNRNVFIEVTTLSAEVILDIKYTTGFFNGASDDIKRNTLFLTAGQEIYGCGSNANGSLGVGDTSQRTSPTIQNHNFVTNPADSLETDNGGTHGFFLSSNSLYAWGSNSDGQFGNGGTANQTSPTLITADVEEVHVISGGHLNASTYATLIKRLSNGLFEATGDNNRGKLGIGDNNNSLVFLPIGFTPSSPVKSIGSTGEDGNSQVWALLEDGRLYGWGSNNGEGVLSFGGANNLQKPTIMLI